MNGNSATYNQSFTADGVISSINAANAYPVNKSYGYDSRFNITAITETGNSARSSTATYDSMSRLNNYSYGIGNSNDYTYNTSEDRTSQKLNGGTATTYNYDSASHKLSSLSGGSTDSMTYDANGNILTASGKTYTYNAANRMATSSDGTMTTNYLINFMGQRTQKSNSNETTWFIYDENDNVIAEYDALGNLQNEYIYLNDKPIALLRNSNLYYIYTDHLNTPRAITDTANNMQWVWENKEAFGNNAPTEVVSGFRFNLRFPGQYFDNETNLNYNILRDYNPVWGRYITSDPLGLAAGINTYGYVGGNSLGFSDKLGLFTQIIITDAYYNWKGWSTGHAAIQINDKVFGFFPSSPNFSDSFFSKGIMNEHSLDTFAEYVNMDNKKTSEFILNINNEQEKALLKYFQNLKINTPIYNLTGKSILGGENCASVISKGIKEIIPHIKLNEFAPFKLRQDLTKMYINAHPLIKEYNTKN